MLTKDIDKVREGFRIAIVETLFVYKDEIMVKPILLYTSPSPGHPEPAFSDNSPYLGDSGIVFLGAANREARLVALEELRIKIGSAEPTVRDLQELLRTKYGITVSVGTVHKDAQAIGFDFTRERPGPIGPEQLPLC